MMSIINKIRKQVLQYEPIIVDGKTVFSQEAIDEHLANLAELESVIKKCE